MNKNELTNHIELDGIRITIKRSDIRTKSVGFRVLTSGESIVTMPQKMSEKEILAILKKKLAWIKKCINEVKALPEDRKCEKVSLVDGTLIPFKGVQYKLVIVEESEIPVQLVDDQIIVSIPKKVRADSKDGLVRALLRVWFYREALLFLQERVAHFAKLMGLKHNGITIKSAKSYWGRCLHSAKTLEFSWKVMILPLHLIDYLVVHELAHIKHPDHSPKFWNFVDQFFDHNSIKGQLKKFSFEM